MEIKQMTLNELRELQIEINKEIKSKETQKIQKWCDELNKLLTRMQEEGIDIENEYCVIQRAEVVNENTIVLID